MPINSVTGAGFNDTRSETIRTNRTPSSIPPTSTITPQEKAVTPTVSMNMSSNTLKTPAVSEFKPDSGFTMPTPSSTNLLRAMSKNSDMMSRPESDLRISPNTQEPTDPKTNNERKNTDGVKLSVTGKGLRLSTSLGNTPVTVDIGLMKRIPTQVERDSIGATESERSKIAINPSFKTDRPLGVTFRAKF